MQLSFKQKWWQLTIGCSEYHVRDNGIYSVEFFGPHSPDSQPWYPARH